MKRIDGTTTLGDLQENPKAYGLPTFEEYQKSASKWKIRDDQSFAALDRGPNLFRNDLQKVRYKINGVSLPNQEAAEKAILDHGFKLSDLELGRDGRASKLKYEMKMIPQGAGKYDVEVNFLP